MYLLHALFFYCITMAIGQTFCGAQPPVAGQPAATPAVTSKPVVAQEVKSAATPSEAPEAEKKPAAPAPAVAPVTSPAQATDKVEKTASVNPTPAAIVPQAQPAAETPVVPTASPASVAAPAQAAVPAPAIVATVTTPKPVQPAAETPVAPASHEVTAAPAKQEVAQAQKAVTTPATATAPPPAQVATKASAKPAAQAIAVAAPAKQKTERVQKAMAKPVVAPVASGPAAQPKSPVQGLAQDLPDASVAQSSKSAADLASDETMSIDTADMDEPQGNWLFKRMWWQRAQTQYEKIKALTDTIMESRLAFFAKRTEWDKTVFDPFYIQIGVGRGTLEELIATTIAQIDKEDVKEGELTLDERSLLTALKSQKDALEQLQKDIQQINAIDGAIDDAITTLINQINAARSFEKKSWQNLKNIAQELSDKNARDLYYGMATFWQNINDISTYIQGPFSQYFEKLGSSAKEQTAKVTDSMQALKEHGIDFKKQWQNLQEQQQRERDAHEYRTGVDEGEKEAQEQYEQAQKKSGFFASIRTFLSTIGDYVVSGGKAVWDFTIGRFFKKAETKVATEDSVVKKS